MPAGPFWCHQAELFCETMNFAVSSPTQIAWVTTDLDATETALTGLLGVRKWVRIAGVHFAPDTCSYYGKPADFVASISLSYLGDMQLELISRPAGRISIVTFYVTLVPVSTTSAWRSRARNGSRLHWLRRPRTAPLWSSAA
ncbi:hypothetical protein NIIDMKKI_35190 [Mycobacterium kansasii]|uniref:Uncharacterized protein n=1 Tax=Mycobacterium kansasii TaxID=1768 RepID=A0A7G1IDH4_MYCKA|nr:hypothetical protein NIIDMKKI_35190 [Mycobacterium kansasii]